MIGKTKRKAALAVVIGGALAALGGCASKPEPAPPPVIAPPPPPPAPIPPRPTPPNGASRNLVLPPIGADGLYQSPNRGISTAQTVWNLRSAYNVAALNCPSPEREEITAGYARFLRTHVRGLAAANRAVDAEFRAHYGAGYVAKREAYITGVYNHFATPHVIAEFCRATLAVSRDAATIKPAELEAFAVRSLPNIEIVFDQFNRRYAQYQSDLAAWDAQYGAANPHP